MTKFVETKPEFICALDISSIYDGLKLIGEVAPEVDTFKLGIESITAFGAKGVPAAYSLYQEVRRFGKRVFCDAKLHDTSKTVLAALNNLIAFECEFVTVHAQASDETLGGVASMCAKSRTVPLAVTALTDLTDEQCVARYGANRREAVLRFAQIAWGCGIRGFVCSTREVTLLRAAFAGATIIATNVAPTSAEPSTPETSGTPYAAIHAGANGIVVGGALTRKRAPYLTARDAAKRIREEIESAT